MEFKFRAVDDRQQPYLPPSSTVGYFPGRAANYQINDPRGNPTLMRNEMVQREIEKQRIREEIIAEEIGRRRELEAEVRRELMIEREMRMRMANGEEGGPSFEERSPFPWMRSQRLVVPHVRPASEDKLIFLAKPDSNLCGAKRKATASPTGRSVELLHAVSKKKPKEEWSCALCQVSATSETGLNEHLQGRKHKAKEAGLRANKMAKNTSILQIPKRNSVLKLEAKTKGESLHVDESENDTDRKGEKDAKDQNVARKNECGKHLKQRRLERAQREERTEEFRIKKKFKFWCETCRVGAYSTVVMEAHKKGRKHNAQLRVLGQDSEACQTVATMVSSSKNANDAEDETETVKDNGIVSEGD